MGAHAEHAPARSAARDGSVRHSSRPQSGPLIAVSSPLLPLQQSRKSAWMAAPRSQCASRLEPSAVGGSWNSQGDILLGNAAGGLVRCPASGGPATTVTVVDQSEQERHLFPSFLSDGRHFIYLRISRTKPETSGIYTSELGSGSAPIGNRLITTGFGAVFVAGADSELGFIVFARDGSLLAQRFDEQRLRADRRPHKGRRSRRLGTWTGRSFQSRRRRLSIARRIPTSNSRGSTERVTSSAPLAHRPGLPSSRFRRKVTERSSRCMHHRAPLNQDLWLFDLSRSSFQRRVTFEPTLESSPVWSTNDRFVFGSTGGPSGVYQQTVDGQPQLLFTTGRPEMPTSITPDEGILLFTTPGEAPMGGDVSGTHWEGRLRDREALLTSRKGSNRTHNSHRTDDGSRMSRTRAVRTRYSSPSFGSTRQLVRCHLGKAFASPRPAAWHLDGAATDGSCST